MVQLHILIDPDCTDHALPVQYGGGAECGVSPFHELFWCDSVNYPEFVDACCMCGGGTRSVGPLGRVALLDPTGNDLLWFEYDPQTAQYDPFFVLQPRKDGHVVCASLYRSWQDLAPPSIPNPVPR